jgi:non-canonical purine NTP pyrophosphatase (RdgB/HAM1 family)
MTAPIQLFLATSNPGKLREYQMMTGATRLELLLIPEFETLRLFEESAPTFAENAAGKAMHYSRFVESTVLADDSGLVVPALGGRPGIHSARYAGPGASDEVRVRKLLREMEGKEGQERRARFVCICAIARNGRPLAVVSDFVEGILTKEPHGKDGFGYDPIFFFEELGRTYAETTRHEKNRFSHRGKAFRKIVRLLTAPDSATSL